MVLRRRPPLSAYALVVVAVLAVEALTGLDTGLLYLAPALLLGAPLLLGRYVGEQQLQRLGRSPRRAARRTRVRAPAPRSRVQVMQRGGRLVATAMAKRPPPSAPLRRRHA